MLGLECDEGDGGFWCCFCASWALITPSGRSRVLGWQRRLAVILDTVVCDVTAFHLVPRSCFGGIRPLPVCCSLVAGTLAQCGVAYAV